MTTKITVTGVVQGVGFRPACKKIADQMGLTGTVRNCGGTVEIVIKESKRVSEEFLRRLALFLPDTAHIESVKIEVCVEFCGEGFAILDSLEPIFTLPEIIPDIATCERCISELNDKNNRRYRHPFISCTVCGPRFSIIKKLPYDRENTLMGDFSLCENCFAEYVGKTDRRLHAQTVACKRCGPELSYYPKTDTEPLSAAIEALKNGLVVAVKDIGGFHFAADPMSCKAVKALRELKMRDSKPFAVMFSNISAVKEYAAVSKEGEALLLSPARPIVLLKKLKSFPKGVCDDSRFIGAMLPSNPVQYMLAEVFPYLIMTSGNISGEPIITENSTMLRLAKGNAFLGGVLYHDRGIVTPLDDSICYVQDTKAHIMRRGRGMTPKTIKIAAKNDKTIFAAGGDLKACFGFYKGGKAILSQHLGDLEDEGCSELYGSAKAHFEKLYDLLPDVFVCDMHPAYKSREGIDKPLEVQHHHAHIASVMAEHSLNRVLGFALDGTGYGPDGSIWGGEALLCDGGDFKRIAHLAAVPICGGDSSAKNAATTLACFLLAAGEDVPERALAADELAVVKAAIKNNINTVLSSSAGRLFDAVAALLGICSYNDYEGKCAILLENAAAKCEEEGRLAFRLKLDYNNGVLDTLSLIKDINSALKSGADINSLALGFHYALAEGFVKVAKEQKIPEIALSGGVFQNRILTSHLAFRLKEEGFKVYLNEKVPSGDGGIALGQLYIAAGKE